MIEFLRCINLS